ncbi:MAG: AAA family ATPase [Candidatus Omnitrophica bacterium]|nr:AAA family ATPase [Candidatus Omnitrophota bacterium]MBD3269603.1 AAA family ATPase [Candidatus Omnitrophota bacterium]
MKKNICIDDAPALKAIFGVEDKNLTFLEGELGVNISVVPEGIAIKGPKPRVERAAFFIDKIIDLAKDGFAFNQRELSNYISSHDAGDIKNKEHPESEGGEIRVPSSRRKAVFPKTGGQKAYIKAIHKHDIVFATGPAGTGKTYLAMAMAVNFLMEKKVRRIILTRPAIEAGESLGFLPGDMYAKLGPYLRPLYDALYDMMEADVIEDYLETGIIEIAPLAYMRGRTLNNAFIVLDEAQNCTSEQLRMFLTRLGFDSKTVVTGDTTQSDLPGGKPAGLIEAVNILKDIKGIRFVTLNKKDAVRHPLIQKIIQAYENFYST